MTSLLNIFILLLFVFIFILLCHLQRFCCSMQHHCFLSPYSVIMFQTSIFLQTSGFGGQWALLDYVLIDRRAKESSLNVNVMKRAAGECLIIFWWK